MHKDRIAISRATHEKVIDEMLFLQKKITAEAVENTERKTRQEVRVKCWDAVVNTKQHMKMNHVDYSKVRTAILSGDEYIDDISAQKINGLNHNITQALLYLNEIKEFQCSIETWDLVTNAIEFLED